MDILYVCKSLPQTYKGGIQTHVWKLSEWMMKLGHNVFILSAGSIRKGYVIEMIEGRQIYKIPYFPGRKIPFLSNLFEEIFFNYAAFRWLKKNHSFFDIIHLQGRSGFLFPGWAKRNAIKNLVATFHNLTHWEYQKTMEISRFSIEKFLHAKIFNYFEKKNFHAVSKVIAVSNDMRRQLLEYIGDGSKIQVINNGVDPTVNKKIIPKERKYSYVVFVGRLERIKGVQHLVKAAKYLNKGIKLVLVGDGPQHNHLFEEVVKNGVQDKIIFTGRLENHEVCNWISGSIALILPSYYESQGIVLLEANSLGKPVIVPNIRVFRELIQHGKNGVYVNDYSPKSIAEMINYLDRQPMLALKMGVNGKKLVNKSYTWRQSSYQTQNIYFQLIQ